jgi:predicted acyltransferase
MSERISEKIIIIDEIKTLSKIAIFCPQILYIKLLLFPNRMRQWLRIVNWHKLLFLRCTKIIMMAKSSRLFSLDIFRGLTVAFMIIVNTPGSWTYVYEPLRHAKWSGYTPTDMVFPFFLFIVGMSIWFSLKKFNHEITGAALLRIFRRVAAIFAVGLFLTIVPWFDRDYSTLRIMGVLQRIALAYGFGSLICISVRKDYIWIVVGSMLLLYWGIMVLFGGPDPFSLEGNFALKFDKILLGEKHLYKGFGIPFDPEGLFSTIPAICTVLLGFLTGDLVGKGSANGVTVIKLLLLAAAGIGLGLLWDLVFPINKPLWTSSYVLFTAGAAIAVFSFFYLITDIFRIQRWALFLEILGTNALFAFSIAILWTKFLLIVMVPSGGEKISLYGWFYEKVCVPVAGNLNGSLLFAIVQLMLVWAVTFILYRKKIFIRL